MSDQSATLRTTGAMISPTAVYTRAEVENLLGLAENTIRIEIGKGRLRVSRRAGRYYFLGRWLIEWIESGEVRRRPQEAAAREES